MRLVSQPEEIELKMEPREGFMRCSDLIRLLTAVIETEGDTEVRVWDEDIQDYRQVESAEYILPIKDVKFVGLV